MIPKFEMVSCPMYKAGKRIESKFSEDHSFEEDPESNIGNGVACSKCGKRISLPSNTTLPRSNTERCT